MKITIKWISLLSLFFCSILSANASDQTVEIRTIRLSPYGVKEGNYLSGLYYDMANLIVSNAGYSPNNKVYPYARILKEIKHGKIDLTIMFRHPALYGYVDYIGSLPSKNTVVIGLQGKSFKSIADLSGKKITQLRGGQYNNQIDNDKSIEKHMVNTYSLGVKMLIAGRVDAMLGTMTAIKRTVFELERKENIKINLSAPLIVDIRTPWIQLSQKSSEYIEIEKLKKSFLQLEKQGVFNMLDAKYTHPADLE